jgi:hypothetical protein
MNIWYQTSGLRNFVQRNMASPHCSHVTQRRVTIVTLIGVWKWMSALFASQVTSFDAYDA